MQAFKYVVLTKQTVVQTWRYEFLHEYSDLTKDQIQDYIYNYGVEGSHFELKDSVLSEDITETSITPVQ
jgi:hypothetical protein